MDRAHMSRGHLESIEEFEERKSQERQARIDAFAQGAARIARGERAPQPYDDGFRSTSVGMDDLATLRERLQYLNERS